MTQARLIFWAAGAGAHRPFSILQPELLPVGGTRGATRSCPATGRRAASMVVAQAGRTTHAVHRSRPSHVGKWVTETYYHFHLQAHDPATADRLWKKELLTVKDDAGGHTAQARLLGQAGEIVWLFLNDQPVAVSSKDGRTVADRSALERQNPELRDLIPKELDLYAYDDGLVITAADARRFRIEGSEFRAQPYTPPNDEYFRQVEFMATRWNGGYHTQYSPRPADDAGWAMAWVLLAKGSGRCRPR